MQQLCRHVPVYLAIHTRSDDRLHVAELDPTASFAVRVIGTDHRDVDPVAEIPIELFEEVLT